MRRHGQKRNSGLAVITVVVLTICVVFAFNRYRLEEEKEGLLAEKTEYEEKLEEQKERADMLKERSDKMQSIRYIEEMARQKLGLVFPNEIIFKPETDPEER